MLIVLHQDTFGHHHGGKDALEGILGQVHPELSNQPSVCRILSSFINIVFVFWKTKPTSFREEKNQLKSCTKNKANLEIRKVVLQRSQKTSSPV